MSLDWLSDNLVELRGPVNLATGNAINDSAVVNAYLYDTALDTTVGTYNTTLSADAVASDINVDLIDGRPFKTPDLLRITLDNGAIHLIQVTDKTGNDTIEFAAQGLPSTASAGNLVEMDRVGTGAEHITLADWSGWIHNYTVEFQLDDLSFQLVILQSPDRDLNYGGISASPNSVMTPGAVVRRRFGPQIAMVKFGTFPTSNPVVGDPTWGFRGVIASDHVGLALGMRVRAEITATDGTLDLVRKAVGTVINQ